MNRHSVTSRSLLLRASHNALVGMLHAVAACAFRFSANPGSGQAQTSARPHKCDKCPICSCRQNELNPHSNPLIPLQARYGLLVQGSRARLLFMHHTHGMHGRATYAIHDSARNAFSREPPLQLINR